jgi:hypothetical protein
MSTALNATKDDMDASEPNGEEGEVEYEIAESVKVEPVTEEPAPAVEEKKEVGLYSWAVLGLLLAIRVVY